MRGIEVWGGVPDGHHLPGSLFEVEPNSDRIANLTARAPDVVRPGWPAPPPIRFSTRRKVTPCLDRTLRGAVRRTILRGRTVAVDGQPAGVPGDRRVVPAR